MTRSASVASSSSRSASSRGGRLVTRTTFGALTLAGVRTGGEFVYLRAQQPTGFFVGTVTRVGGDGRARRPRDE